MLTRPLTLNETDDRGRDLTAVTPPPALPLAGEGDDDDETQMRVFSPPVPPSSSSSSSSSSPPFCGSSSPSAPPLNPPRSFLSSSSLTPPPPPAAQSLIFSVPAPPLPPPVFFAHHTLPTSSSFSPSLPPPPSASSDPFISPYPVSPPRAAPSLLPPVCPPPPPLPPPSYLTHLDSIIPAPSTVSPPSSSHFSSPMSSSPLVPVSLLSSPVSPRLPVAPPSSLPPPHVAPAPLPPPVDPLPVALSPPPPSPPPVAPSLPAPPPLPPPCCPCSSLLPRLLSAHRLEVRRLLRGALASLGRRLDSLERKSRRKKRKKRSRQRGDEERAACSGSADLPFTSASSCSSAHLPPVTIPSSSSLSSSSSDSEDSPTPPVSSSLSQSKQRKRSRGDEEGEGRRKKKRRKNHRRREMNISPENREEDEEEVGRFVGRMAVSFRRGEGEGGEKEELPLTLHNFNHRKHKRREGGRPSQSQKAISVVRENGYTTPLLLHSISSSSSQRGWTSSQSEALSISSGQWRFSDLTLPFSLSSNHSTFNFSLCSSALSPAPMLRLSAVAVETISESVRGGAYWSPLRPLKDWTAPPSLSSDHCYVRTLSSSTSIPARRQQKQRANHSSRSLHLPRRRALPLPLCSANGLSAPLPVGQSAAGTEFLSTNGERGKRVSQIRIRRASPREMPLTPMGLPKVKRLKKKEFSLEEIYTNKNYKSPTTNRSLETIFEEPREKDGEPLVIGQQRRRRLLLFPDFTQPRKRKRPQGAGLPVAMVPRKRAAARRHCHGGGPGDDESDLDVMLVERLSALEDFLTRQGLDV